MIISIRARSQKGRRLCRRKCTSTQKDRRNDRYYKSSVHRHRQAIKRRNQYPESSFWETAAGSQWLSRLIFGLVYYFGIKQGVGAESLSEFICAMHLDTHVASSASALRQLKQRVNQAVVDYEKVQSEHCVPAEAKAFVSGPTKLSSDCRCWCC